MPSGQGEQDGAVIGRAACRAYGGRIARRGRGGGYCLVYFAEIKDTARNLVGLDGPVAASRDVAAPKRDASLPFPWPPRRAGRVVEIKAGSLGHYYARVEINGRPVDVMVDSGPPSWP